MNTADREKLVEAFERAVRLDESGFESMRSRLPLTRAALLAAMGPVEIEGLVDEVVEAGVECDAVTVNVLCGHGYKPGDRVRVSKVEAP